MLTAASSWRECTGCFCLASPVNLAFTCDTEITLHLNNCPVQCTRNVGCSESRRSAYSLSNAKGIPYTGKGASMKSIQLPDNVYQRVAEMAEVDPVSVERFVA